MEIGNNQGAQLAKGEGLIDILIIIVRWRKFILLNTLFVVTIAFIVLLFVDKWYSSTASIVPPRKKGGVLGESVMMSGKLKDITKSLGRIGSSNEEAFDFLTVLQSRTASEKIIARFDLRHVYKFKEDAPIEKIIEELSGNVKFNVEEEGNITIKVMDKNPDRAAAIANYYVQILNEISIEMGTHEAMTHRVFLENRYRQIQTSLQQAEENLREFSKKNKVVALDEQTKASMKELAELNAQKLKYEIEYEIAKMNLGLNDPNLIKFQMLIEKVNSQIAEKVKGSERNSTKWSLPIASVSDIGIEMARIIREFEIQNKLFEFILPLYEQAKIDEQKDIPICLVLDKAVPAQIKSAPKKGIILVVATFLTFFVSIFIALVSDRIRVLKNNTEIYSRIENEILLPLKRMLHFGR